MIRKILLASTAGLAGAMIFAAPAAAQAVCEINGTNAGGLSSAAGIGAVACGVNAQTANNYSIAIGGGPLLATNATGTQSIAIGGGADALGFDSVSVGMFADTSAGGNNVAIGGQTSAGTNGTAVGFEADANGLNSTALGQNSSTAAFTNSVALGANTTATANDQVAVGGRTISGVTAGAISATSTEAVNGAQINTIVVAQDTRDDGQDTLIAGLAAATSDSAYFAVNSVGPAALATGTNAIAIGQSSVASGTNSIAIGNGANNGGFANSVAIGGYTNTAANQVILGGNTAATARVVTGVANGTTTYDAVNFGQLTATNSRVTALEAFQTTAAAEFERIEGRFEKMGDRMKAGTAVAIAMSGNGFLPDKRINVTGNLGFYSGAYAGALQVGSVLTDNIAFNAGVAKSFNRGGKMGARFGFTFGW